MIEPLNQAIVIARKHDEQIVVAQLLAVLANLIKHTDVKRAIDILLSTRELSEQLGYRYNVGHVEHVLGHILGFRGETSAAIEHHLEYQRISGSLGHLSTNAAIAFYVNQIGDGTRALELISSVVGRNGLGSRNTCYIHFQKTWALINLGRNEEAKTELEITHELALKSGESSGIMYHRIAEGILYKAECNHDAAIDCFSDVLNSIGVESGFIWHNICLLNLVEIEIKMLDEESLDEKSDSSGPWMQKLEEHAKKNDLPGVAAQSMILKAKLRHRQGQYDEVRKILKEVKKIAQAPSMKFLNDVIISKFPDIIVT